MEIPVEKVIEMINKWENNIIFIQKKLDEQKNGLICGEQKYFPWQIVVEQNKINLAKKRYNL